jgi:hypothetical protein
MLQLKKSLQKNRNLLDQFYRTFVKFLQTGEPLAKIREIVALEEG